VEEDAAAVVSQVFDEAERRDPGHRRTWVALVDGNNHQIDRIQAEARARQVDVTIVVDFVHVLEYLWKAAWCFFDEGDPDAERWVRDLVRAVLKGHAAEVAAALRRAATRERLDGTARATIDECAGYLVNKRPYLDYPTALERGWPIATGVIEGACRHLIKDRMDITGARWVSTAPKPSSSCVRSSAMATSSSTGAITSRASASASTVPAMSLNSSSTTQSRHDRRHSRGAAPVRIRAPEPDFEFTASVAVASACAARPSYPPSVPPFGRRIASIPRAVSRFSSGRTWVYVFMVSAICEWPSSSMTIRCETSRRASSSVAHEWRRSWNRIFGRPHRSRKR
jgi:hypothetical protein